MNDITFSFTLDKRYIKHLTEKSSYNHNYYLLDLQYYGDYIIHEACNILYEENDDISDSTYYTLGYFDDNDKFVACWTWLEDHYKNFRGD